MQHMKVFFLLVIAFFMPNLFAQFCVDNQGLSVVFINGVRTSRINAINHLDNLERQSLINDDELSIRYVLAYNHHENFFVDLFQSNYQIIESQRPGEYWNHLLDLKSYSTNTEINQGISQGTIESIASFIALSNYTNARITGTIQSELDRSRKILIIAHSQGTLYANSSYQAIVENEINKERIPIIGMLHVASVANIVGSSGINIKLADYTSYVDDLIVSNVSIRYNILPALHDVMFGQKIHLFEADHTLHGFSEIYIQPKFADSNNNETLTINNLFNDIKLKMKGISSLLKCPQALGCLAIDGEGLPGKFFTNPDGTEGGFVSNDSTVSPTVYLGAEAEVCNGAQVFGQATIVGPALISDSGTVVNNNAIINGNILVNSGAQILQSAQMLGHSGIGMGAKLTGNAILKDSAVAIGNVKISEDADIGGNSFLVSFGDPQEKEIGRAHV